MIARLVAAIAWLRWRRYRLARKLYIRLLAWVDREGRALIAAHFGGLDDGNGSDHIRLHDCGRFHRTSEPCPEGGS